MNKCLAFRHTLDNATGTVSLCKSCRGSIIASLLLLTAGCAAPGSTPDAVDLQETVAVAGRPDGGVRIDTDDQDVAKLWASAERARSEDRSAIALELLYEALDIAPQNALLWSRAAELKLDTVEPALAENYAVRSNDYAGDNRALLLRNWLIIEHARNMRGDLLGVRSAHKQVEVYQQGQ